MDISRVLLYTLTYGLAGSALFTLLVFTQALSDDIAVRDEAGNFNFKQADPMGKALVLVTLGLLIGVPAVAAVAYARSSTPVSFLTLFLISYGVFFVINLWDLVVIDYLIVVRWHPDVLRVPNTPYYTTVRPHIEGFIRGTMFGLVFSLVAAGIAWTIM